MASRDVQRYYDLNTSVFLRIGSGGASHAIHRGLWPPGVRSNREAADHVNTLIADRIRNALPRSPALILDLGCGVGGTLFSLAQTFPAARLHGITISARQVAIADGIAREKGIAQRCHFHQGNFENLYLALQADAIIAVESFIHSSSPERFFMTCHRHLARGGVVIIVDDFLARPVPSLDPRAARLIEHFRQGWHVPGLCTVPDLDRVLEATGFARLQDRDLSSMIRTHRPRDRLVALASHVAVALGLRRRPFWANVTGGHALNRAIQSGWVQYRLLTLARRVWGAPR